MQNFKDKIYNYESVPPEDIWSKIVAELDSDQKVVQLPALHKRSRLLFYSLTAAASLFIIFISSWFFNKNDNQHSPTATTNSSKQDILLKHEPKDSLNNLALESIIRSSKNKSPLAHKKSVPQKKYITIAGPGGQPVKISSKVATLIVSADDDYPPKAVWDKKINKWKQIMLSSTLSPTATNLVDIVELSSMRGDN